MNVKVPINENFKKMIACKNMLSIPIFMIPGVEVPFRSLGLNHNTDGGRT